MDRDEFPAQLVVADRQAEVLLGDPADGVGQLADGRQAAGDDEPPAEHQGEEGPAADEGEPAPQEGELLARLVADGGQLLVAVALLLGEPLVQLGVRPGVVDEDPDEEVRAAGREQAAGRHLDRGGQPDREEE